jgi:hypothetical protein
MMESFVIYDPATGQILQRGANVPGSADEQAKLVSPTAKALIVPAAAFATADVSLDVIRAGMVDDVNAAAEATRLLYITPGAGQAMTYTYKADEARAWTADNSASVPFLTAEATARGMTIAALAAEVIGQAGAWISIGSKIEAKRMAAKAALASATTIVELIAASIVDWSGVAS